MDWLPIAVLGFQIALLLCFGFFAWFNYLYGFAALKKPRVKRTLCSGEAVAVVIVSYNERYVLPETVKSCEALSYPNKLIVLSDDSDDESIVCSLRALALSRGCRRVENRADLPSAEIWESPNFVYFHRPANDGFKGGNLCEVSAYLRARGIRLMYLLDADWHPQRDTLERALEILEADRRAAFVQTRRITAERGLRLFQRYVALSEEGCYYVDFEGRQALRHPILFSGCCTLLRLDAVRAVGGFARGHLTEDLDVTNRLWLAGWRGVYSGEIVNYGEVPFTYQDFRRQQERWSCGTARCLKRYFWPLLRSRHLNWAGKLAAIRQNAYFSTSLLTLTAILQGVATVAWLAACSGTYPVEYYLYLIEEWRVPLVLAIYWCALSNFVEPAIMIVGKKRRPRELIHLPMGVWYAWSVLLAYVQGNIKGLFGIATGWFCTPKFIRGQLGPLSRVPRGARLANSLFCGALVLFYVAEGWFFGWRDPFAFLLVPAFLLSAAGQISALEGRSRANQARQRPAAAAAGPNRISSR